MAKDSRGVVIEALAGNGSIALAKSAAAWITGSTAMFTEAIHSPVARRRPMGGRYHLQQDQLGNLPHRSPFQRGVGWLMEVAWPGELRQRWVARIGT